MLDVAKSKLQNHATLCFGDAQVLPYEDNSFDIVYCNDSFHHYPNPQEVLKEVRRVLRYDGVFILGDAYARQPARTFINLGMKKSKDGDVKLYSKHEILTLFHKEFHSTTWIQVSKTSYMATGIK